MKKNGICSFVFVAAIMLLLFVINGYAPFGASSLACNDARIQYIDFFLYLKDVFEGQNSISYSFSKMLGGSAVSLYSYYLASPLNLLLVFFRRSQVLDFFDLLVLLKTSLSAASFAVFLSFRFPEKACCAEDRRFYILPLSAGYGLSQFAVAQSCNIMWLDGVYMLPLVMLGVYKAVNGRSPVLLAVSVALSVLFNWYTAGMNCLFSAFWFLLEWLLACSSDSPGNARPGFWGALCRYLTGMILGLLCSAVLFLPTVVSLRGSEKSRLRWDLLGDMSMRGSPLTVFSGFLYGAQSQTDRVSLFCGTLPLLGLFGCFSGHIGRKQRGLIAAAVIFVVLMFYWTPLYTLFNLLEDSGSYSGRFSYLQIFSLLFFAAWYFLNRDTLQGANDLFTGALLAGLMLLAFLSEAGGASLHSGLAIVSVVAFSVLLSLLRKAETGGDRRICRVLKTAILVLTAAELLWNADLVLDGCTVYPPAGAETPRYIEDQTALIGRIRQQDDGACRITQTLNRWTDENRWTANYSEPLGYGYSSLTEYSSTVSSAQTSFLERAGYKAESDAMNIVNTCILGVDSLCGVKYVLSDLSMPGLTEAESVPGFGTKKVYQNPFAFPLAFTCSLGTDAAEAMSSDNPFVFQNRLFEALFGEPAALYTPLEYQAVRTADPDCGETLLRYRITLPEEESIIYGNLPYEHSSGVPVLDLNGYDSTVYACWLSPSVFRIPAETGDREAAVTAVGDFVPAEGEEQFYALDLAVMEKLAAKAQASEVRDPVFQNGHISLSVNAAAGERLFLSVPCDPGWHIRLNGETVSAEPFAGLFCTFTLREGENRLQMDYRVPFLREGLFLSLFGLGVLGCSLFVSKSRFRITRED